MTIPENGPRAGRGGVDGFTLIELLVVVVIIGLLAAIAVPRFTSSKEGAYIAQVRGNLRHLITAQHTYLSENDTYTSTLADLTDFEPTDGVTVTINSADATGWDATATHSSAPQQCAVAVGSATNPLDASANSGVVVCTE